MEGFGYPYPPPFPPMRMPGGDFPDHGDGFGEYYGLGPLNDDANRRGPWWPWEAYAWPWSYYGSEFWAWEQFRRPDCGDFCREDVEAMWKRSGGLKPRKSHQKQPRSHGADSKTRSSKSRSQSGSRSRSRSRSRTRSRTRSKSRSKSHSRSQAPTRSCSVSRPQLNLRQPSILDAFRIMYLTPSKHRKSTTKYLTTKKRQDRIQELLKSDGLGSKHWYFYPRQGAKSAPAEQTGEVPGTRDNCDQRIKVDADFLRNYKSSKKYDADAPITKLKRWELVLFKRLGFIQAV